MAIEGRKFIVDKKCNVLVMNDEESVKKSSSKDRDNKKKESKYD